jgi:diguanylate cyclase (GGDEF)-like protein/PAS domain S-box-containing protein
MMSTQFLPRQRRYLGEWLFLLVTLLLFGGFIGYSQYQDYLQVGDTQRDRLKSLTAVIEKNLVPQLRSASKALESIGEDLPQLQAQKDDHLRTNHRLKLLGDTLPGLRTLLVVNAAGTITAANNAQLIGADLAHREWFQTAARNNTPQTFYVIAPIKSLLNTYAMGLARSISGPNGEFAGAIYASLNTDFAKTLLDSVLYTPDARSFLIHGDGKLFMAAPERPDLIGKDLAVPNSMFSRHRSSGQEASVFEDIAYVTDEARLAVFRTIQPADLLMDKPLVVVASRDLPTLFAAWRRTSGIEWGVFGTLLLLTALSLFFYQRRQRVSDRLADSQQQALQTSEARLHSFFDATPDAQLISDEQGLITLANQQVERLLGYTPTELVGQSIEILVPDRSRQNHPGLRIMFATSPASRRMGQGLSVSARCKDGSEVEVEISLGRIETGQGLFFACGLRDITDRKQAEAALRASEDRLNEAQRIAHVGNWMLDLVSGELHWSDEVFRLFEIDPTRFGATYEAFLNGIHPDDRDAVNKAYANSLVTRAPYEITHRLLMSDGRIKWVQEKCLSDFDAAGSAIRSRGTVQDVSLHKQSEEQLRIAATAFESQEAMMVTDANSLILRVNRAFTTVTGYTAEEAVGQTPRMLHSGRHDADFFRAMWETINRTGGWQGEVWDRRKNGEIYPKWLNVSAVKDDRGAVTHYVGTHFDITERKQAEEKINALAFFDQLTGLPNRTLLLDRLKQAMTASDRSGSHGALLFIDLDNFKELNDTLGHEMGDLLLKQVAQRLTQCVREGDTVARLGGDEFVVILTNLGKGEREAATGTETAAEKILATLNQIYRFGELAHHSTASIGATLFNGHPISIDNLMKQADLTMYKAKEAGRNTLRFFDPAMEVAVKARAALESDLRAAVEARNFVLHYQAQVAGGQVTGAEVLVRWKHQKRGMVSPAEFIPLAEETGLILPLGHLVLETACTQLAAWATQPAMAHFTLAVNVSALQFKQSDFVDQVLTVLDSTGANPRRLKLELTESMLADNVQDIIEKMFALKAKGVGFSLDDFGTGYSSLSYLKRLPLDQLKIDQSFVRDVMVDANDAAIAKTIVALAQSLGLGVIAEGVETEAQLDFLASSGCHAYQGYFFSRPLPVAGFEEFAQRVSQQLQEVV